MKLLTKEIEKTFKKTGRQEMKNYLICIKCSEIDDKKTKTGATIDDVYFCEGCYWDIWEEINFYITQVEKK